MGWFQRTFSNSPIARIERAELFWTNEEFNKVRMELEGLTDIRAQDLYNSALQHLKELNLKEGLARFSSGDSISGEEHLELARTFGGTHSEIQTVRNEGRAIILREKSKVRQKQQQKAAKKKIQGDDPIWSLPPDDPRLQYAIHLEGYPVDLRERLVPLGQEFAQAVLATQNGSPENVVSTLSNYIEREPAVHYERARAAIAAGDLALAISDLMTFGSTIGHQVISNTHTGALLGQLMAQVGRSDEGIETLSDLIKEDTHVTMRIVRSQLYIQQGQFDIAEKETQELLKEMPRSQPLIRQLASIRLQQDNRISAANVLEAGFASCCETGTCSAQRPDVQSLRLLARIYLEDRALPDRCIELLKQLQGLIQKPTWEDQYLITLQARNNGDSIATSLASQLLSALKKEDPRRHWVEQAFQL